MRRGAGPARGFSGGGTGRLPPKPASPPADFKTATSHGTLSAPVGLARLLEPPDRCRAINGVDPVDGDGDTARKGDDGNRTWMVGFLYALAVRPGPPLPSIDVDAVWHDNRMLWFAAADDRGRASARAVGACDSVSDVELEPMSSSLACELASSDPMASRSRRSPPPEPSVSPILMGGSSDSSSSGVKARLAVSIFHLRSS
jgi:hypothetical protein